MRTKKSNIIRACDIAAMALLVFTILQFADGDVLYNIGNGIEEFLHIHTEINVETMREYFIMIFSGIFASTIVALSFYIVEYQCEKRDAINKLIKENNRLSKLYLKLPYIDTKSEYGKLCVNYYFEVLQGIKEAKCNKDLPHIILSEPLNKSIMKNTYEAKLVKYLKQNRQLLHSAFDNNEISIDQKLKDIFIETRINSIDALEIYSLILNEDLEELKNCIYGIVRFWGFSNRIVKKVIGNDEKILLGIQRATILNRNLIENRILTLHERMNQRVNLIFEEVQLDIGNINSYMDNYDTSKILFYNILCAQDKIFGKTYHQGLKTNIIYNEFAYHLTKLNSILFYDLTKKIDNIVEGDFASRIKMSVRGGHIKHTKIIPGDVMYGDIYRQ